jgi:hypothetical protein
MDHAASLRDTTTMRRQHGARAIRSPFLRGAFTAGKNVLMGDAFLVSDIQKCTAEELDNQIASLLGTEKFSQSPTSDAVVFCSLIERFGIAVYPTASNDDTRGPPKWHGQSYELLGHYSDKDMKIAGCRALLRKLLEMRERAK